MQIENKCELVTVRYKNLDEYLSLQHEYIENSWVVVSEHVDNDLSMLVEYKRLVSGKTFDILRIVLQYSKEKMVSIHENKEIVYSGSVEKLLKSKIIADTKLLKRQVRSVIVVDNILRVEV